MKNKFCCLIYFVATLALLAADRPNIVWIVVDDQGPDWACYGNTHVSTPNLDSLAQDGIIFDNAFAVAPVCSPSHTSIFTGTYPSRAGFPHHRSHYLEKLPKGFINVENELSKVGYYTANLMSLGSSSERIIYGATGKTDLNYNRDNSIAVAQQSGAQIFDYIHEIDNSQPETFFQFPERQANQPFFAYVNIETGKAHGFGAGQTWAKANNVSAVNTLTSVPGYLPQNNDSIRLFEKIYDSVSHTDNVVGKFITGLKATGEYDNTLIIVATDHGYAIMRHKQTLFDSGLKVGMIAKFPNQDKQGTRESGFVTLMDYAKTSLDYAQVDTTGMLMDSQNLSEPSTQEYAFAARDGVDGIFDRSRTIRSSRYRLIAHDYPELPYLNGSYAEGKLYRSEFRDGFTDIPPNAQQAHFIASSKPPVELYDLQLDPEELNNLAADPAYATVLASLSTELMAWQVRNNDLYIDYRTNGESIVPETKVSKFIPSYRIPNKPARKLKFF